jgi:hypothetical protein
VAEKTVVVEADPSVTPESMLEKLKKVGPLPSLRSLLLRIMRHNLYWNSSGLCLHFVLFQWSAASGKSVELA